MSGQIKILYLIDQLTFGGAERHLVQVLKKLDRSRFEPHLWVLHGKWDLLPEVEKMDIPFQNLNLPNILTWKAIHTIPFWVKKIKAEKFQILHTYLFASNIYGQIIGGFSGIPLRVSGRREMENWMSPKHILFTRLTNRWVHQWIVVSRAVAKNVSKIEHVPIKRLTIIPNGVDIQRFSPEIDFNGYFRRSNIPEDAPLVLNVGSYRPVKGQITFVKACQKVVRERPDVHCAIVGEAREPVLGDLQKQLRSKGGDNIHLLPPTSEMQRIYPRASLLVVSSHFEGFSNAILEAGASGVPVIATNVGGNPESVVNGQNGFLIPAKNSDAMAKSILTLLAKPEKLAAISRTSRHFVQQNFSLAKMIQTMESCYIEWLEKRIGDSEQ